MRKAHNHGFNVEGALSMRVCGRTTLLGFWASLGRSQKITPTLFQVTLRSLQQQRYISQTLEIQINNLVTGTLWKMGYTGEMSAFTDILKRGSKSNKVSLLFWCRLPLLVWRPARD